MLKQRHQLFVTLLGASDGLVIALASLAAWGVRRAVVDDAFPSIGADLSVWLREPLFFLTVPLTILSLMSFGLYRPRRDGSLVSEHAQILRASLSAVVCVIVVLWGIGPSNVGGLLEDKTIRTMGIELDAARVQLAALALILPNALGLHRALFRLVLRFIRRRGWNLRHVAVIGTGRLGRVCCRTLDRNTWTGIHVAFFVSHHDHVETQRDCLGRPVMGGLADLDKILEKSQPDAVYLAIPTGRSAVMPALMKRLERHAVDVRIVPDVLPRYMPQSMQVAMLDGMPVLSVRESPMNGFRGMVKRMIDFVGAALGLIVFAPVMLVVAAIVRLSSPGPVIFKQRRVSLGGEVFNIYKFRTMYHAEDEQDAPAGWTQRADPRITPVGKWLRQTSLDELPQLFNVVLGDMSLVGPRPERPELIQRFRDDWRGYMLRQHVKAGITGWAQVNGLRGDTSLKKRLQHDLFYIRNWSLGFDLKILWLTLFRGFVHRNAH